MCQAVGGGEEPKSGLVFGAWHWLLTAHSLLLVVPSLAPQLLSTAAQVGEAPGTAVALANQELSFWLSGVPSVGVH